MITEAGLNESLGRLSALKRFPSNPFALVAIVETLRDLCPTDEAAICLVGEVMASFEEWCSPLGLRKVRGQIVAREREAELKRLDAEQRVEALRQRDSHESECLGYAVLTNSEHQTVDVEFCHRQFGAMYSGIECGRGKALRSEDAEFCNRRQAEELTARPGWVTVNEYWKRRFGKNKAL